MHDQQHRDEQISEPEPVSGSGAWQGEGKSRLVCMGGPIDPLKTHPQRDSAADHAHRNGFQLVLYMRVPHASRHMCQRDTDARDSYASRVLPASRRAEERITPAEPRPDEDGTERLLHGYAIRVRTPSNDTRTCNEVANVYT